MSEKTPTIQEIRAELAKVIKTKVEAFADHVKTLRAKELSKSEAKGGKLSKAELCPLCGNPDRPDTCTCLRKSAPPGEEKLVHKLKDEYGHDKEGKSKAFATAWAIKNGTVNHKAEMVKAEMCKSCGMEHPPGEHKPVKKAMPSSSAAALAPPAPKPPATSVAQANKEMSGFKSVVKGEGSPASPSYGANVDPADKAGMPKTGKDIPQEGSGGKVTKGKNLAKAAVPAKAAAPAGAVPQKPKAVVGVPGKQPVGEGGGDAFKTAATSVPQANKEMAGFKSIASNPTAMPGNVGVHPNTAAGLKDVKSLSPNAQSAASWKGQGLPGLLNRLKTISAAKAAPVGNPAAPAAAPKKADALQGVRDKMNLQADMKSAGVGWVSRLLAARKPAPVVAPPQAGGQIQSQRFHGALPLRRAEPLMKKPAHSLGNCALCSKEEHSGMCKTDGMAGGMMPSEGLASANHNRRMLSIVGKKKVSRRR